MGSEDASPSVFVGINIAGGEAYLGAVRAPREPLVSDPADRISPNSQLDMAPSYEDFRARLAQELRRLQPAKVGVARTRKYRSWSMADATTRFGLEAAAMLAAAQEGFECQLVTQEDAARTIAVPLPKLIGQLPGRLDMTKTPYWAERSVAFLVAAHLAEESH